MKKLIYCIALLLLSATSYSQTYKPDWEDLNRYPQAEWLNELKFGMYWHWNYNSIGGNSGWYGRKMYEGPNGWHYKYHIKKYSYNFV